MGNRHANDEVAERFCKACPDEQQQMADQIAKLPEPKAPRIVLWVGVSIILVLLGAINFFLLIDLAYMKPDLRILALIDTYGLAGIVKAILFYRVSKPSVYNMLAEYEARHGHLPVKE
ncbi:MAG: hypothetical protein CEO22_139 [Candidatus Berkelbacteria bacterium Gr01-1014_85]|uniref:Uncharacterized protein n=1 Tax=Candidatus Berkelbacteria bacterium Gr01-1014_85 TaxID=2017150 RepID=A0A554JD47_9BACT|nr:MAG: hypothetical protein CEO22_139 [Candidatus Berkelbacteria bacterium Gr01-1014_85]